MKAFALKVLLPGLGFLKDTSCDVISEEALLYMYIIIAWMETGQKVETIHSCQTKVTEVDAKQDPLLSVHMLCWEFVHCFLIILRRYINKTELSWIKDRKSVFTFGQEKALKSSLLGISNGSPDIKDKLVRESKVSKGLIKCHCKFIWVLLITTNFNHCSSWKGTSKIFYWTTCLISVIKIYINTDKTDKHD